MMSEKALARLFPQQERLMVSNNKKKRILLRPKHMFRNN